MTTQITRSFQLEAHAKVNLCLSVAYPPKDGFHQLESVFQELDLHDVLTFTDTTADPSSSAAFTSMRTPVELICPGVSLDPSENLVFKALDGIERACGTPLVARGQVMRVNVEKHIPAGGGLGGGSSDAACALRAYAQMQGLNPLGDAFLSVGRSLGADVPFFLYGGAALMEGRGDVLVRCLPRFPLPLVLMGDEEGCSTPAVYRAFDRDPVPAPDARKLASLMESASPDAGALAHACANNLAPAACAALPRLKERLEAAKADPDVLDAHVTGSGSTSFAVCADEEAAQRFASRIAGQCAWTRVAHAAR